MTNVKAYCIMATRNGNGLPTFYLLPDVQGIVSEDHAKRIAFDLLGNDPKVCVNATLVELNENA